MKYKVGDRVKVRSWADMEQEFGLTEYGYIKTSKVFKKEMRVWCNKVVIIKEVHLDYYFIKEDGWRWTDEMIDHKATKILSIIDRLEMLKKLTGSKYIKKQINSDINSLKSNKPKFYSFNVNYYNNIFRKLKGKK